MSRTHLSLHHGWTLTPVAGRVPDAVRAAGPIPASVPGTVHTDLLDAGLIPDPYLDDNERLLAWISLVDWRYETTFTWSGDGASRTDLVFEGLDTVAAVELNGHPLARTRNMHRTYRLPVTGALREGTNRLSVTFESAVRFADGASLRLGARPHVNEHPYNAIRKMACSFGWDWGPDLATAGVWRPVSLQAWSTARLATVRPVVSVVDIEGPLGQGTVGRGTVAVHVDVERADPSAALLVTAEVAGARAELRLAPGEVSGVVAVAVDEVALWWPRGHGGQPLHDLTVTLARAPGDPRAAPDARGSRRRLDRWAGRVGFRTVRLDLPRDADGTGFAFVVNDRPLFIKGANWIPDDAFPHRVTRSRYAARLAQAEEAGLNLIRVWGGGIFEADDFYAECDERGLMVWQDFLFACAAYSEEEPMRSEVVAEARDNVTRLMGHASLVHWSGGNENLWGRVDWDWGPRLDGRSWGEGYYQEVLPAILAELDPGRPYSPGSPYSPEPGAHPNDPAHATTHLWETWNELDYTVYRDYRPRFVAEFGWQGPPAWSTMRRAISDDPMTPESPGMLAHQKAAEGHRKLTRGLVAHLPVPDDLDAWHWAMSLTQARAVQVGVESFRSLGPQCAGSIMWQLNDCWPVTSWAAVDGDGRRKPLLYALRHAHAHRLATIQPRDGLVVVLVNDTAEAWSAPVRVARRSFAGAALAQATLQAEVPPWSTRTLPLPAPITDPADPARELIVADAGDSRALWWFVEDRDSALPTPALVASADRTATGYRVEVTAVSILRDLALLADKVEPAAVVSDMLITLLPGETATWDVTCGSSVERDALLGETVLRSANQLVHLPVPTVESP